MHTSLKVLDLFSGMGGFSYGFKKAGFEVTGLDSNVTATETYRKLTNGNGSTVDLYRESVGGNYAGIIGGPPCKPWSTVNLHRRKSQHKDYELVNVFFQTVKTIQPEFFIMENVPAIKNDPVIHDAIAKMEHTGYRVVTGLYKYSDFGAAVARKRFFIAGIMGRENEIFHELEKKRKLEMTVFDAIWKFRKEPENALTDHEWPHLKTIRNYGKYYESGKYGWHQLVWKKPAPSFGNVMKTYTLHPEFGINSKEPRVISVLESLRIMGFDGNPFPKGTAKGKRYQMIVDSVSPIFSNVFAETVYECIRG